MKLHLLMAAGLSGFALAQLAQGAVVAVTAAGVDPTATNLTWLSQGLATLNGSTSGVAWQVSGQRQGADWNFVNGTNQTTVANETVQWPIASSFPSLGYTIDSAILDIGPSMAADVGAGKTLLISEVSVGAGDYTLNGVTQTSTALGQVLEWTAPSFNTGDSLTFTSTASVGTNTTGIGAGPIGFSSVPEPASLALLGLGGLGLLARRRRNA